MFFCRVVGQVTLLLWLAIVSLRFALTRRSRCEIVVQMFVTGIKSLGVITIVAVFTGMILALQTGIELRLDMFPARLSHWCPLPGIFDQGLKVKDQSIHIAFLG